MSTFSSLNIAYSGLVASRRGLDVIGQNIVNVNTVGYTRQRIETTSLEQAITKAQSRIPQPGNGVQVTGISRLGDAYADARVRETSADASYWLKTNDVMASLESRLNEPSDDGLSKTLQRFWTAWQNVANQPGETAPASVLLEEANTLATQLSTGYRAAQGEWASVRGEASSAVAAVNESAGQVAELNDRIRETIAAGGSANELVDKRNLLIEDIVAQTGATVKLKDDGTADILLGGSALVEGGTARQLAVTGADSLETASDDPVTLEWTHRPGQPISAPGGSLAASLELLGPADAAGTGGAIATFAAEFDHVAQTLADTVNAVHRTGAVADGTTGHDFFSTGPGPAALTLKALPTDASGIAAAAPGRGSQDGSIADEISQLGSADGSADAVWNAFVVSTGVRAAGAENKAEVYQLAYNTASDLRLSQSGVDLDEELTSMLTFQRAYQGSARVLTAIDEVLDTLINRTGVVGR